MPEIELSASLTGAGTYSVVTEHFATEREVCLRAVELIEGGNVIEIRVNGGYVAPESFAARLTLIEARRKAVAVELLCQTNGIWLDRLNRVPDLGKGTQILDGSRTLSEAMYEDADRLIAAYEQVTV